VVVVVVVFAQAGEMGVALYTATARRQPWWLRPQRWTLLSLGFSLIAG
jgi:hypothetical protein